MNYSYHQSFRSVYEPSASTKPAKLIFLNDVASPVFTKETIKARCFDNDHGNKPIKLMLVDINTGENITTGPLASAKVKIVLLLGDCGGATTGQKFHDNIVVKWGKKENLLLGHLYVDLKHGCGTVGEIRIKHDRNPLKTGRFRLGAMVVDCGRYHNVKEAITKPFEIKDRRNMPKFLGRLPLDHKVCQLQNISKKGMIYKRLKNKGILTVRDFLCKLSSNLEELQEICCMKGKRWETTVNHAKESLVEIVNTGSTSQQLNTLPSYDNDGSIELNSDCYKPSLYLETDVFDEMMIEDKDFSIGAYFGEFEPSLQAYEGGVINGALEGGSVVKKRWMKLRVFGILIASFTKKLLVCSR